LICRRLIDRGDLLRQLSISGNDPRWADATLSAEDLAIVAGRRGAANDVAMAKLTSTYAIKA
jgi:hypothetical protein